MWHRVKDLWTHNRVAFLAFVIVLCLTTFFGVRTVSQTIYWADPARQNQALAEWMTPRYVARSYGVPPELVKAAWGMAPDNPLRRASLDTIAAEIGLPLAEMERRVTEAAAAWHQGHPDE
ncbi:hypothetical protein AN191_06535 [Loktanella sp. 5RATIMAR09]|uniref:hypothetical protein n=1 Tax=Loktanella sp. 5RATIMAR09 TaxID=1225655 RepID=UPI0006EB8D61|nr:hypothetical protein [Loktanella sp. 5RATIMAR09]KQI72662.1 hypothetical protein AN191_06535 [Loktanella sp. 5RATIMAR09]